MATPHNDVESTGISWSKNNTYEEKNVPANAAESVHEDALPPLPTDNTLARKLSARQVQMIAIGGESCTAVRSIEPNTVKKVQLELDFSLALELLSAEADLDRCCCHIRLLV